MLKVKKKYLGKKVSFNRVDLVINDIPEKSYEYYNENGLDYIFEELKDEKTTKFKGVKEYAKNKEIRD